MRLAKYDGPNSVFELIAKVIPSIVITNITDKSTAEFLNFID